MVSRIPLVVAKGGEKLEVICLMGGLMDTGSPCGEMGSGGEGMMPPPPPSVDDSGGCGWPVHVTLIMMVMLMKRRRRSTQGTLLPARLGRLLLNSSR